MLHAFCVFVCVHVPVCMHACAGVHVLACLGPGEKEKIRTFRFPLIAALALQPVARPLLLGESEPRVDRRRPIGRRRLVRPGVPAKNNVITKQISKNLRAKAN